MSNLDGPEDKLRSTETVADPYRTDPREARIKELEEDLAAQKTWNTNGTSAHYAEMAQLRANHAEQIEKFKRGRYVRGFGKLMLAAFTILWLLVNSAGLALPVYLVLELHKDMSWLHFMWLSVLSWIFFYFHISSLSEKT